MSVHHRLAAVRQKLKSQEWDAIVITSPANRLYLTGYTAEDAATDESAGALIVTGRSAHLIVSPTNLTLAASEVEPDEITVMPWTVSWPVSTADHIADTGARLVAVEDATTTAASWFALQDLLSPAVTIVAAGDTIDALRAVKSAQEIALLAEAARCTDAAFLHAISQFKCGMTELQAANIVRDALRTAGSDGEAFDTIVAFGPNAAKPHHRPGSRAIVEGEPIIIDMGARIDGYNGDLSRTVCLDKPDQRLVAMYEAVLAAQCAGLDAIRAGALTSAPDTSSREVFAERDLTRYVIHSVGHGLGLRVHEAPSVSIRSAGMLAAGNVITIEPGLYVPDWGGVRIEDVAVVEDDGYRNLSSAPKGVDAMLL